MSEDKPHMTQLWQQEVDRRTAAEASLAEKTAAWTKSELRRSAAEAKVARLEGALHRTADQALKEEIPGGYVPEASADWHAGYDAAIRHARAALTEGTPE